MNWLKYKFGDFIDIKKPNPNYYQNDRRIEVWDRVEVIAGRLKGEKGTVKKISVGAIVEMDKEFDFLSSWRGVTRSRRGNNFSLYDIKYIGKAEPEPEIKFDIGDHVKVIVRYGNMLGEIGTVIKTGSRHYQVKFKYNIFWVNRYDIVLVKKHEKEKFTDLEKEKIIALAMQFQKEKIEKMK